MKPLIRVARFDMRLEQSVRDKLVHIAEERNITLTQLIDEAFIIVIALHEALKKNG